MLLYAMVVAIKHVLVCERVHASFSPKHGMRLILLLPPSGVSLCSTCYSEVLET